MKGCKIVDDIPGLRKVLREQVRIAWHVDYIFLGSFDSEFRLEVLLLFSSFSGFTLLIVVKSFINTNTLSSIPPSSSSCPKLQASRFIRGISKMSPPLVLLTGGSGHLGFRTLVVALESGFRVRAAVRSKGKADAILATPSIKALASAASNLSFVIVPDISTDGAYDEALKDVTYVVHVASPIPKPPIADPNAELVQPALKGTLGILTSAKKVPSVKRVVITSSIAAVVPPEYMSADSEQVFTASDSLPNPNGPYTDPIQAYLASKTLALNASIEFVKREEPSFDVINILPSYIVGKNELNTETRDILLTTNAPAVAQLLGQSLDNPYPGSTVHLDDTTRIHILALDSKVKGNRNFGATSDWSGKFRWSDAIDIAKRRFPEAVKDGRLPLSGETRTCKLMFDSSETEKVLGIKFQDYEAQVVSATDHYLEVLAKNGQTIAST